MRARIAMLLRIGLLRPFRLRSPRATRSVNRCGKVSHRVFQTPVFIMPLLVTEPVPDVTLVTIDNESKRNAMSRDMMRELAALWRTLDASNCRCVVLTGAGDQAFCAGADIGGDLSASEETARMVNDALLKTRAFHTPVIAAVNGVCAGGGVELMLSTDIRIAASHARFGLPEVCYGIYPFGGATIKLRRQIGYVHAMDLLLTGRLIDAETAREMQLINEVVEPSQVLDVALDRARMIAANSPDAVQAVKAQISGADADYAQSQEAREQQLGDAVRAGKHFAEGVSAFMEKRKPDFS